MLAIRTPPYRSRLDRESPPSISRVIGETDAWHTKFKYLYILGRRQQPMLLLVIRIRFVPMYECNQEHDEL